MDLPLSKHSCKLFVLPAVQCAQVFAGIVQVIIEHQDGVTGDELEREMFILRKLIEKEKADRISATPADADPNRGADAADFYLCTLSCKTMVYKVGNPDSANRKG